MPDWRPRAHFSPARHWMNDPNGLVHHEGTWHLFFQHNPEGSDWGNMSWGHATSTDLVHWTEHPVALAHDLDAGEQVFSGSVVVDHENTSGLRRDGDPFPPFVAVWTSARDGHQAQWLACSRDAGATWERCAGPVLDRGSADFRDPKVSWWEPGDGSAGSWLMVAVEAVERLVVLYRSADLWHWELLSELGPLPEPPGIWECPDLVRLPVEGEPGVEGHVLVLSGNDGTVAGCGTWCAVGSFDGVSFTPDVRGFQRLDHGPDDYAAVTWNDAPDRRRVLLGWMANWAYAGDLPTTPWRGAMTLPRELSLRRREGGGLVLVQRPVEEARSAPGLEWHEVELDVRDRRSAAVELWEGRGGDAARIGYDRITGLLSLERGPVRGGTRAFHPAYPCVSSVPVPVGDGVLRLEVAVDSCSVEVFAADGEVVLTALVFPEGPQTFGPCPDGSAGG